MALSRFAKTSEDDVNQFIKNQQNKETEKKTKKDIGLVEQFIKSETGGDGNILNIPPQELNQLLAKFIVSVRKADGTDYEPSTLRGFVSSIDRHLKGGYYRTTVISGLEFEKTRQALKAKQKQLKAMGKGCKKLASQPISNEEIVMLWENGQFGVSTPTSIINTLWFYTTVGFGLRASHEHRAMCWGDVTLNADQTGHEYLSFNERQTKTRQGDNGEVRKIQPKLWANKENPDRCPIAVYKAYSMKRPESYCDASDPFYVATSTVFKGRQGETWFKKQPIGQNKLNSLMKKMATTLPSDSTRLTNHSARKHLVQNLVNNNVPPTDIIQISGHKNIQSVLNYSHMSNESHKRVSSLMYPDMLKRAKLTQVDLPVSTDTSDKSDKNKCKNVPTCSSSSSRSTAAPSMSPVPVAQHVATNNDNDTASPHVSTSSASSSSSRSRSTSASTESVQSAHVPSSSTARPFLAAHRQHRSNVDLPPTTSTATSGIDQMPNFDLGFEWSPENLQSLTGLLCGGNVYAHTININIAPRP